MINRFDRQPRHFSGPNFDMGPGFNTNPHFNMGPYFNMDPRFSMGPSFNMDPYLNMDPRLVWYASKVICLVKILKLKNFWKYTTHNLFDIAFDFVIK